jgi:hypothetical protein
MCDWEEEFERIPAERENEPITPDEILKTDNYWDEE